MLCARLLVALLQPLGLVLAHELCDQREHDACELAAVVSDAASVLITVPQALVKDAVGNLVQDDRVGLRPPCHRSPVALPVDDGDGDDAAPDLIVRLAVTVTAADRDAGRPAPRVADEVAADHAVHELLHLLDRVEHAGLMPVLAHLALQVPLALIDLLALAVDWSAVSGDHGFPFPENTMVPDGTRSVNSPLDGNHS